MIGSFRIDLYTNSCDKVYADPITSTLRLALRQELDNYSSWDFDVSVSDPALANSEGKDFDVFWLYRSNTLYLGRCSYLSHSIDAAGRRVAIAATGSLRDLTRQTVLQRAFDGASDDVNDVLGAIVPLRTGWALGAVDTITNAAPLDFWYETIFDSVSLLAATFGKHFREGNAAKSLDFGAFGTASGVMAFLPEETHPDVYTAPQRCT